MATLDTFVHFADEVSEQQVHDSKVRAGVDTNKDVLQLSIMDEIPEYNNSERKKSNVHIPGFSSTKMNLTTDESDFLNKFFTVGKTPAGNPAGVISESLHGIPRSIIESWNGLCERTGLFSPDDDFSIAEDSQNLKKALLSNKAASPAEARIRSLFHALNSRSDVLLSLFDVSEHRAATSVTALHVATHIERTRALLQDHNTTLKEALAKQKEARETARMEAAAQGKKLRSLTTDDDLDVTGDDRFRDQGFSRARVLVLAPFRAQARQFVSDLLSLHPLAGGKDVLSDKPVRTRVMEDGTVEELERAARPGKKARMEAKLEAAKRRREQDDIDSENEEEDGENTWGSDMEGEEEGDFDGEEIDEDEVDFDEMEDEDADDMDAEELDGEFDEDDEDGDEDEAYDSYDSAEDDDLPEYVVDESTMGNLDLDNLEVVDSEGKEVDIQKVLEDAHEESEDGEEVDESAPSAMGLALTSGKTGKKKKLAVFNKQRFVEEFEEDEETRGNFRTQKKPADWIETFGGNCDDAFRLGISFAGSSVKLFASFEDADVIVASPLSLRLAAGKTDLSKALSSVEQVVVLRADVMELFQNLEHLEWVFTLLNQTPKDLEGVDIRRLRLSTAAGQAAHLRQTIALSQFRTASLRSLLNRQVNARSPALQLQLPSQEVDFTGVQSTASTTKAGKKDSCSVQSVFETVKAQGTRQVLQMVPYRDRARITVERCEQFRSIMWPSLLSRLSAGRLMIVVPSYLEFLAFRRLFKKMNLDFLQLHETSSKREVSKSRMLFATGRGLANEQHIRPLLITERFLYLRRYRLKGADALAFPCGPPTHPKIYLELCKNLRKPANGATAVFYSDVHALALERILGDSEMTKKALEAKPFKAVLF